MIYCLIRSLANHEGSTAIPAHIKMPYRPDGGFVIILSVGQLSSDGLEMGLVNVVEMSSMLAYQTFFKASIAGHATGDVPSLNVPRINTSPRVFMDVAETFFISDENAMKWILIQPEIVKRALGGICQ